MCALKSNSCRTKHPKKEKDKHKRKKSIYFARNWKEATVQLFHFLNQSLTTTIISLSQLFLLNLLSISISFWCLVSIYASRRNEKKFILLLLFLPQIRPSSLSRMLSPPDSFDMSRPQCYCILIFLFRERTEGSFFSFPHRK